MNKKTAYVYIATPMGDDKETYVARKEARESVKHWLADRKIYFLDQFYGGKPAPPNNSRSSIWEIGEMTKSMSFADYVYFAKGWDKDKACLALYGIAFEYGITSICYGREV